MGCAEIDFFPTFDCCAVSQELPGPIHLKFRGQLNFIIRPSRRSPEIRQLVLTGARMKKEKKKIPKWVGGGGNLRDHCPQGESVTQRVIRPRQSLNFFEIEPRLSAYLGDGKTGG